MINQTLLPDPRQGHTAEPDEPAVTALSEAVKTVESRALPQRMSGLKALRDRLDEAVVAAAGAAAEEGWDTTRMDAACPGYTHLLASSLRLGARQA